MPRGLWVASPEGLRDKRVIKMERALYLRSFTFREAVIKGAKGVGFAVICRG